MPIENDIQELTAEIRNLIAQLKQGNAVSADEKETPAETAKGPAAKKDKAATTPKSSPASAPITESSSDDGDSPAIEYATIQSAVLEVSKKSRATAPESREQAVALLARFGVTGISKLDKEHYPKVLELSKKIMTGELDATAAVDAE